MKTQLATKFGSLVAAMALGVMASVSAAIAQPAPVSVHGKVLNPAGGAVTKGDVKFSVSVPSADKVNDPKDLSYKFSFPVDATGNYKATGLEAGTYIVVLFSEGKYLDYQRATFKAGDDSTLDFDMSREEFLKGMSPEDRKALEEYKKKNAVATADNAKIANINAVLNQARSDEKAGKPDDAVTAIKNVIPLRPDEAVLYGALGEAQLGSADLAYKNARAAKQPASTPEITQKYVDTAASFQKAIDLSNAGAKKPAPEVYSSYYQNMGSALAKSGKSAEAAAAYDTAAKDTPASAGKIYYNEAANFFNMEKLPEAKDAADKCIAADPKNAEAYYIKAQALVPGVTIDEKTKKYVLPPGCLEAYQEYLDLAPTGPHAAEVKDLLANLGQQIKSTYKAPGKKG